MPYGRGGERVRAHHPVAEGVVDDDQVGAEQTRRDSRKGPVAGAATMIGLPASTCGATVETLLCASLIGSARGRSASPRQNAGSLSRPRPRATCRVVEVSCSPQKSAGVASAVVEHMTIDERHRHTLQRHERDTAVRRADSFLHVSHPSSAQLIGRSWQKLIVGLCTRGGVPRTAAAPSRAPKLPCRARPSDTTCGSLRLRSPSRVRAPKNKTPADESSASSVVVASRQATGTIAARRLERLPTAPLLEHEALVTPAPAKPIRARVTPRVVTPNIVAPTRGLAARLRPVASHPGNAARGVPCLGRHTIDARDVDDEYIMSRRQRRIRTRVARRGRWRPAAGTRTGRAASRQRSRSHGAAEREDASELPSA